MRYKIIAAFIAVVGLLLMFAIAFRKDNTRLDISNSQFNNDYFDSSHNSNVSEHVSSDISEHVSVENSKISDLSDLSSVDENSLEASAPYVSLPAEDESEDSFQPEVSEGKDSSDESIEEDASEFPDTDESLSDSSTPEESVEDISEPEESASLTILTYDEYLALSPAQQQEYFESFPSFEEYIAWYNAALKEYEDSQNKIEVSGDINIGDYVSGS